MGVPAVPAWADRAESRQGGDPSILLLRSSGSSWKPLTCGSLPLSQLSHHIAEGPAFPLPARRETGKRLICPTEKTAEGMN